MEKAAFEGWLESVSTTFLSLNDQQRNQSLDHLISLSGAAQLRHLSNGLETLLKRDFLRLLPLELAFYLMRWLDPQTLLTCCLVCKQWNKVKSVLTSANVCVNVIEGHVKGPCRAGETGQRQEEQEAAAQRSTKTEQLPPHQHLLLVVF